MHILLWKQHTCVIIYRGTYNRQTHVYLGHWYLSVTSVWAHSEAQILSNVDGFLLLRKMSCFFPSSVRPNERKIWLELSNQIQLHAIKVFKSVITYWMDAAASGGHCSTGNNSQTPSRCSLALTRGWMGPCCQSPSNRRNTGNWKIFLVLSNQYQIVLSGINLRVAVD